MDTPPEGQGEPRVAERACRTDKPGDPDIIRQLRARLRAERLTIDVDGLPHALCGVEASTVLTIYDNLRPENQQRYVRMGYRQMLAVAMQMLDEGIIEITFR